MLLFAATFVLMLITLISKKIGEKKAPYLIGTILISLVFLISFIGAIVVAIVGATGDYDDWWHGGACFVGNIAPILILPFLVIALIKTSKKKKDKDEE
jgi:MFS family permease